MAFVLPRLAFITLFLACFSLALPEAAQAGFEWIPPTKLQKMPKNSDSSATTKMQHKNMKIPQEERPDGWNNVSPITPPPKPENTADTTEYIPVPHEESEEEQESIETKTQTEEETIIETAVAEKQEQKKPEEQIIIPSPAVVKTELEPPVTHTPQIQQFSIAVGFGTNVPLAFATEEIIPKGFTHAFGKGIDLGMRVSWNGGKPWNKVIEEMIKPYGLYLTIDGQKAFISRNAQPTFANKSIHVQKSQPDIQTSNRTQPNANIAPKISHSAAKTYIHPANKPTRSQR